MRCKPSMCNCRKSFSQGTGHCVFPKREETFRGKFPPKIPGKTV